MARTKQQGYHKLKNGQWLHFSMNCWINLKQECGLNFSKVLVGFNDLDEIDQVATTAALIYSAALAYNQEEGIDSDLTIYQVRNWMDELTADDIKGVMDALAESVDLGKGKKKAKK